MSFDPRIGAANLSISAPAAERNLGVMQSCSSSLAGRTVMHLGEQEQINADLHHQVTKVSGLNIDQKLVEQPDEKEQEVIIDEFKPVCYPGYYFKLYCSYDEIISAIESWGTVKAILMADGGLNHTFIVSFKRRIEFVSSHWEGMMVNLTGGQGIWHTPFFLRGMYGPPYGNAILSNYMMAFDIQHLPIGQCSVSALRNSQTLLPDPRLSQINATFSESDKAKKLLAWIKQSGLSILEKGLYRAGSDPIDQYSVDEIIANYTSLRRPWQVVMRAPE